MEPFLINFLYSNLALEAEAVPKKILDLMNVEKLTRENVASHLQAWILIFLFSVQYDLNFLTPGSLLFYFMVAEIQALP
jgi:SHAQKYF class myb-like DNA-binding protein